MFLTSSVAILAIFGVCTLGAPTPSTENSFVSTSDNAVAVSIKEQEYSTPSGTIKKRFNSYASGQDRDLCGDSTFINKSSEGSPTVADCICVRDYASNNKGSFTINSSDSDDGSYYPVITCGTCRFGVDTSNFFGTSVGNADIRDVMNDAIARFQSNGKIGAEGSMGCDNAFETAGTRWAIYHS